MAITVIKHGKQTFKVTCPVCGCEFTYDTDDLKEDLFKNHYIECPDCKEPVSHMEMKKRGLQKDTISPNYPNVIWTTTTSDSWPDCETCPNKPDPNKIVVGDTPCTWCRKNQPYCAYNYNNTALKYTVDTSAVNEVKLTCLDNKQKE